MKRLQIFNSPLQSGAVWGLAGALVLTFLMSLHGKSPNPFLEITSLAVFLIFILLSVFSVNRQNMVNKYLHAFIASFTTYVLVITTIYLYKFFIDASYFGFMWKNYFIMCGIGVGLCLLFSIVVAVLFLRKDSQFQ